MRSPDRIAIDAFSFDHLTATPLDGVINPENQFSLRGEGDDQQAQQNLASRHCRPARAIQNPMIVLKVDILALAHNLQARCDGAFAER